MYKIKINNVEMSMPSVTKILNIKDKPALVPWAVNSMAKWIEQNAPLDEYGLYIVSPGALQKAKREYRNISDDALNVGSIVHDAILKHIEKEKNNIDNEEAKKSFDAFLDWEQTNAVEWLEAEKIVLNIGSGYTGRFDAIAKINGKTTLLDFKTSKDIYSEMKEQLGAYWFAYKEKKENYKIEIQGRDEDELSEVDLTPKYKIESFGILRLDKETGFPEWKTYTKKEVKLAGEGFKTLTKYYYQSKKRRLKNNVYVEKYWGTK